MTDHNAHASKLTIGGRDFRVRRTFALICRIEERFGPLLELAEKLEKARLTFREMADLFEVLLADSGEPVDRVFIEEHVIRAGTVGLIGAVHPIVTSFFVGEDRFMKRIAEQEPRQAEGNRRAADMSPGANLSAPLQGLAGHPQTSGPRPSTNSRPPYPPNSATGPSRRA